VENRRHSSSFPGFQVSFIRKWHINCFEKCHDMTHLILIRKIKIRFPLSPKTEEKILKIEFSGLQVLFRSFRDIEDSFFEEQF
jgi:hypothetical protein